MEHSIVTGSDYLAVMLHPKSRKLVMNRAVRAAKTLGDFDTIAFMGNSGVLFGPELARRLNKQMLLVNKDGQDRHYTGKVEGASRVGRWVFADDLISSGRTFFRVKKAVELHRIGAELAGAILYTGDAGRTANPVERNIIDYEAAIDPFSGPFPMETVKVAYCFLGERKTYQDVRNQIHSFCGS